ncbi:MAG: DUF134 domain-containing protein [Nanobdellota archaeon]
MVRPKKSRNINFIPEVTYFKPRSIPLNLLKEVEITFDELEAMRLADIEKFNQKNGAEKMNVHQSTFQRTLNKGREKIVDALVNGKAMKIEGGNYKMPKQNTIPGGRGRMGGPYAAGPEGNCVCPNCGHKEKHVRGMPCNRKKCTECGSLMTRE